METTKTKTQNKKKLRLQASPSPTKTLTSKKENLTTTQSSPPRQSQVNLKKVPPTLVIPNNYADRIEFIRRLFDNDSLLQVCTSAPLRSTATPEDIGKYFLTKNLSNIEICAGLLLYMNLNFQVDTEHLKSKKPPDQSPEATFKSGFALSEGLAKLYKAMCSGAEIKVDIIGGLLKRKGYKLGDSLSKHSWCALNFGKFFFVDVDLFIGEVNENVFISKVRPFYFLIPPEYLIDTHRPDVEKWQCLNKTLTVKQFSLKSVSGVDEFFNSVYENKIRFGSFPYPEITSKDSSIIFKLGIDDMAINASIETAVKQEPTKEISFDEKSQMNFITVDFPSNGDYLFTVLGKRTHSDELDFQPILNYKIKVAISNQKPKAREIERSESLKDSKTTQSKLTTLSTRNLSSSKRSEERRRNNTTELEKLKKKCYDNKGAYLFEPRSQLIRIGHDVKFKVKVKDAINVFVLDGRKWNYLKKKEEDVYEGSVLIQNENVVVCSLKRSNVYTEIFEFVAYKN